MSLPPLLAVIGTLMTGTLLFAGVPTGPPAGSWPVPQPVLVSDFRSPAHDWEPGHRGIDLAALPGAVVVAMVGGRVSFAGRVAGRPVISISLPGPGRRRVTYEPVDARVTAGDTVREGEAIGVVAGAGGHCSSRCLHVGLRTADGYRDPRSLLGRAPAVLKPLSP